MMTGNQPMSQEAHCVIMFPYMRQGQMLREYDPPRGTSVSALAYQYRAGDRVPEHAHGSDQLIYAIQGLMEVSSGSMRPTDCPAPIGDLRACVPFTKLLLQDFYLARWQMFVDDLDTRLQGKAGRDIDYFAFEKQWTEEQNDFPVDPSGDPINTAWEALEMATQFSLDPDQR